MRAVVGGTVVETRPWEFADKQTGEVKRNTRVYVLSGRFVDEIIVPLTVAAAPAVGEQAFYRATVGVDTWNGKSRLKVWAESVWQDGETFAPGVQLQSVHGL